MRFESALYTVQGKLQRYMNWRRTHFLSARYRPSFLFLQLAYPRDSSPSFQAAATSPPCPIGSSPSSVGFADQHKGTGLDLGEEEGNANANGSEDGAVVVIDCRNQSLWSARIYLLLSFLLLFRRHLFLQRIRHLFLHLALRRSFPHNLLCHDLHPFPLFPFHQHHHTLPSLPPASVSPAAHHQLRLLPASTALQQQPVRPPPSA
jgi:hypothetical protein